jgi:2',3'-cyclic-nucleotide 2'-phosphodiesterase (5'-nucleotidase family)
LLLDLGDAFWPDSGDVRNQYVLEGYRKIGYDAVVLGSHEWALGPARLKNALSRAPVPVLSSTVTAPGLDCKKVIERSWGNTRIAVVSDARPNRFQLLPPDALAQLHFSSPAKLKTQIRHLHRKGFLVIVAAYMNKNELSDDGPEAAADLTLCGATKQSNAQLQKLNGKPVVTVGGSASVGVIALRLRDHKIADIEYRLETVDKTWPADKRLIHTYVAYTHVAMREALDADRKQGLAYVGSSTCGRCHKQQYKFWKTTRHAKAYDTLLRVRRTGDPNCLMCHTTGFGTEKGFYAIEKTPRLANVNCQACHRFNIAQHKTAGFVVPCPSKAVCASCHTPVTDPNFQYEKRACHIRCGTLK